MDSATPKTTLRKTFEKPVKPWPDFPLYWHVRGFWMKRYRGRELRFEKDAQRSFERWLEAKRVMDGEQDPRPSKRFLLRDAINLYLTTQRRRLEVGEIGAVQFAKCRAELEHYLPAAVAVTTPLDSFCAAGPGDDGPAKLFHQIRTKAFARGLEVAKRHITLVKACLNMAHGKRLMLAPDYSDAFNPPSADKLAAARRARDLEQGERTWGADELRGILAAADELRQKASKPNHHLYAQILLGLFGAFDSADVATVPHGAIDLETGLCRFPRVKNARPRACILPKQVLEAVKWSSKRAAAGVGSDAKRLIFRTRDGNPNNVSGITSDEKGVRKVGRNDTIGLAFRRLLRRLKLAKPRTGFKTLRSCCRTMLTAGGIHEDIIAVIMGRPFRYPVDDYYIRGDLKSELTRASKHLASVLFKRTQSHRPASRGGASA